MALVVPFLVIASAGMAKLDPSQDTQTDADTSGKGPSALAATRLALLSSSDWQAVSLDQIALADALIETMAGDEPRHGRALTASATAIAHREGLLGIVLPEESAQALKQQHQNIEAATGLLEMLRSSHGEDLDLKRAVAVAIVASDAQTATLGLEQTDPGPVPAYGGPSEALDRLAGVHGEQLTTDQQEAAARLDALEDPLRSALTDLVGAFLVLHSTTKEAYAAADVETLTSWSAQTAREGETKDPWSSDHGFNPLLEAGVDLGPVLSARSQLLLAIVDLHDALQGTTALTLDTCTPVQVPPAFSIDLAECDNTYTEDFFLLVDAGGNDAYHNNAGGSNVLDGGCPLDDAGSAAALVDLGGNDVFGDPSNPRGCGVNGGGANGAGLLVSAGGDDVFNAGVHGTNGGGNFGSGFALNVGGNDTYTGASIGVNGGSNGGIGMLVDLAGDDLYEAGGGGTNGGSFGGSGTLIDGSGDDEYRAGGSATNGGASASGAGFLLDASGENAYQAGSPGTNGGGSGLQGAGFLLDGPGGSTFQAGPYGTNGGGSGVAGVGLLVSLGGDDSFVANERGTNGGAYGYGAAGFLVNAAGNDTYQGGHSGSSGGARQGGVGLVFDADGDDHYFHVAPPNPPHPPFQGSFGTNGGGYMGSVGALIETGGDDVYEAGRMGVNGGGHRSGIAAGVSLDAVGLLFDADGLDHYEDQELLIPYGGSCTDCSKAPKGISFGAQVDLPNPPPV